MMNLIKMILFAALMGVIVEFAVGFVIGLLSLIIPIVGAIGIPVLGALGTIIFWATFVYVLAGKLKANG